MFPFAKKAYAQLSADDFGASFQLGGMTNFYHGYVFFYNLFFWLGGAMILGALVWTLGSIARSAVKPDVDTMETFKGGMSKVLMLGFLGVALISLGSVFAFVGQTLGADINILLPNQLDFLTWN
jgi:hypothetical protein